MTIEITWHLIMMVVFTFICFSNMGSDGSLDFRPYFVFLILVIGWLIYGGIFLW